MTNSQNPSAPARIEPQAVLVDAECSKHGAYQAKRIAAPMQGMKPLVMGCPACAEERREAQAAREAERQQQEESRAIASAFDRSGIPRRFMDRRLSTYQAETPKQRRALAIANRFVDSWLEDDSRGTSLVFAGKPGTGKTHIACGIASALIEQRKSAYFGTVLQVVRHVKSTYRYDSELTESQALANLLRPDLLVIDEVGAQIGSEHEKMILFEVINERYQECRSTILISNLTVDELTEFLGDRVLDRFRECGAVVAFDWASHRGSRAA